MVARKKLHLPHRNGKSLSRGAPGGGCVDGGPPRDRAGGRPRCVPGVSWRPRQGVAATRRPGREGFSGKGHTEVWKTPRTSPILMRLPSDPEGTATTVHLTTPGCGQVHGRERPHEEDSRNRGLVGVFVTDPRPSWKNTRFSPRSTPDLPLPLPEPSAVPATATPCRGRGRDGRVPSPSGASSRSSRNRPFPTNCRRPRRSRRSRPRFPPRSGPVRPSGRSGVRPCRRTVPRSRGGSGRRRLPRLTG